MSTESEQKTAPFKIEPVFAIGLDGDLAQHTKFEGPDKIGQPIPAAVAMVKRWLAQGRRVLVITPRVAHGTSDLNYELFFTAFKAWCLAHIGQQLEVTDILAPDIVKFYSWRNGTLVKNTGAEKVDPVAEVARLFQELQKRYPMCHLHVAWNGVTTQACYVCVYRVMGDINPVVGNVGKDMAKACEKLLTDLQPFVQVCREPLKMTGVMHEVTAETLTL